MQRLLKLSLLITIVLLNCSSSWCRNKVFEPDTIPATGVVEQTDTIVSVPVSVLRVANSKMIELKYEKEINTNLRDIISNDSLIIDGLNTELDNVLRESERKTKKLRKQRNIAIGAGTTALILLILALVK